MRRFVVYFVTALIIAAALMAGCREAEAMPTAAGVTQSSSETASSRAASARLGLESSSETESSSEASGARSSDGATAENTTEEYIEEPETPSEIQETAQSATSSQEQETATRSDIQETQPPEPVTIPDIQETSSASSNIQEQKLEPAPSNQPATGWQPGNGPEGADGLPSTGPVDETPSGGSNDGTGVPGRNKEYVGQSEPDYRQTGAKNSGPVKDGTAKWDSSLGGWTYQGAMGTRIIYPNGNSARLSD